MPRKPAYLPALPNRARAHKIKDNLCLFPNPLLRLRQSTLIPPLPPPPPPPKAVNAGTPASARLQILIALCAASGALTLSPPPPTADKRAKTNTAPPAAGWINTKSKTPAFPAQILTYYKKSNYSLRTNCKNSSSPSVKHAFLFAHTERENSA